MKEGNADRAENLFCLISMGMAPEEVRDFAGEPERREIGWEGECWTYRAGRIDIVFSFNCGRAAVSKIIFRSEPRTDCPSIKPFFSLRKHLARKSLSLLSAVFRKIRRRRSMDK